MNNEDLICRIREVIESDEEEVVKVINVKFLFDEYDRSKMEVSA